MDSVSPVWTDEFVEIERVLALDQEQYHPIVVLPVRYTDNTSGMSVRFRLTDDERKAIAEGADIILTELTLGGPFTPVNMHVCQPNTNPFD